MSDLPVNQRKRIRILQLGGLLLLAPLLFLQPALASEAVRALGITLVLFCVAGRMWSVLYVGSRKNVELVTAGPYSMTRNPLYFFSTLGAVGIGLCIGSVVVAFALGLAVYLVLRATAAREAGYLGKLFGSSYEGYARRTPMFWPNPSLYSENAEVTFSPKALRRTFLDGLVFLCAIPLIRAVELLQAEGYLPILVRLF